MLILKGRREKTDVRHELFARRTDVLGEGGAEHHHLLVVGCDTEDLLDIPSHVWWKEGKSREGQTDTRVLSLVASSETGSNERASSTGEQGKAQATPSCLR